MSNCKGRVTPEMAREWARQTRVEQGLPLLVTNLGVIRRVLVLTRRTEETAPFRANRKGRLAA